MKTVIEINGRKYDARTGELLSNEAAEQREKAEQKQTVQPTPQKSGVALDGVNRRKSQITVAHAVAKPAVNKPTTTPQRTTAPSPKTLDIKPSHGRAQRARTLLRTAVKKPQKVAPQIHSTSTIAHSKVERSATGRGLLLKRVPDSRLSHAKQTAKSLSISKFNPISSSRKPRLSETLTVAPVPKASSTVPAAAPAITKPVLGEHEQKQHVFNHSIAEANHHNAPKVKKQGFGRRITNKINVRPRVIGAVAAVGVVVLFGLVAPTAVQYRVDAPVPLYS